jgi:hypothetical protein
MDKIVKQRFNELEIKAANIWDTKIENYKDKDGSKHYKIPRNLFRGGERAF